MDCCSGHRKSSKFLWGDCLSALLEEGLAIRWNMGVLRIRRGCGAVETSHRTEAQYGPEEEGLGEVQNIRWWERWHWKCQ